MSDCNVYGGGNCGTTPTTVVVVPSTQKPTTTPKGDLPFTGGDVVGLTLFGTLMLSAGVALLRSARRKMYRA